MTINDALKPQPTTLLIHCEPHELSTKDINQVNLLYACSSNLQVYIRYARNLRDTDPWLNDPDPYVKIQARRASGYVVTQSTRYIGGTTSPTWNQWLNFGCQKWRNFEMQIWDEDNFLTFGDDEMSNKELALMSPGNHYSQRHNAHGNGYLFYDYKLIRDINDCIPNCCQNGGTCIDECTSYRCLCPQGYSGTNCEYPSGNLVVYARYGRNLPDEDGWWNDSDPYIEFIAVDRFGNSRKLTTSVKSGNHNPNWNQSLNFGRRAWSYFRVRVYDSDNNADDALSSSETYSLPSPNYSRSYVSHNCYSGNVVFDYSYTN
ncbi:slit homolog 1 protein-like [Halichondria panicea]|uniref:slit homolog 1 protein-like n=1 Tax=Halichondria panicea TaxID=6063 RepID=UPI00312B9F43